MREILFKAKAKDTGEWVNGYIYKVGEKTFILRGLINEALIEVEPETVCQYTGVHDKNKKKIFEGDILAGFQYPYLNDGKQNYFAEVVWFDNSPAFGIVTRVNPKAEVRGISDGVAEYLEDFNPDDWEVIGNIFDNPELFVED